jgi:hypothetical protein
MNAVKAVPPPYHPFVTNRYNACVDLSGGADDEEHGAESGVRLLQLRA